MLHRLFAFLLLFSTALTLQGKDSNLLEILDPKDERTFSMTEQAYRLPNGSIEFRAENKTWRPLIYTARHMDGALKQSGQTISGSFRIEGVHPELTQPLTEKQVLRELVVVNSKQTPDRGEVKVETWPKVSIQIEALDAKLTSDAKAGIYTGTAKLIIKLNEQLQALNEAASIRIAVKETKHETMRKNKDPLYQASILIQTTITGSALGLKELKEEKISIDIHVTAFSRIIE